MRRCKKVLSSIVACLMIVSLLAGGMVKPVRADDNKLISELKLTVDFSQMGSVKVGSKIPDDITYDTNSSSSSKTLKIDNKNIYFGIEGWWNKK